MPDVIGRDVLGTDYQEQDGSMCMKLGVFAEGLQKRHCIDKSREGIKVTISLVTSPYNVSLSILLFSM